MSVSDQNNNKQIVKAAKMSMQNVISSFNLDLKQFLQYLSDYGKPDFKYFNFVWRRMGFQCVFDNK